MQKYHRLLEPGKYYHLLNHAVGDEALFKCDENFGFFLKKYFFHTEHISDTLCFALMPNHFHFIVKIKPRDECMDYFAKIKAVDFDPKKNTLSDFIMERFSNFCNAYAKAYNKVYKRKGSLFVDFMKRVEITDRTYLINAINYVHYNPVLHGFCKNPLDWKWTSLHSLIHKQYPEIKLLQDVRIIKTMREFRKFQVRLMDVLPEQEYL